MQSKFKFALTSLVLMCSAQYANAAPYTISSNGLEVTDVRTGLIWRRCSEGMIFSGGGCSGTATSFTHEAALARATSESASSGVVWRVPNVKELSSITNKTRTTPPSIDPTAFPNTPATWFWSSSPNVGTPNFAWYVYFGDGSVYSDYRSTNKVRLVRSAL